jgi:hypothetical protein
MTTVDERPESVTWEIYEGDPQSLRVRLVLDDGSPADVAGWAWRAWAATTPPTPFECNGEDDGVTLSIRGADTYPLVGRRWRFDVTCRNPVAGEGVTVLQGHVLATRRVTQPLGALV